MSQPALPEGRDDSPTGHPIEQTVFAQLLGDGLLANQRNPPGDWGPLELSTYQSMAATNLFVKYGTFRIWR